MSEKEYKLWDYIKISTFWAVVSLTLLFVTMFRNVAVVLLISSIVSVAHTQMLNRGMGAGLMAIPPLASHLGMNMMSPMGFGGLGGLGMGMGGLGVGGLGMGMGGLGGLGALGGGLGGLRRFGGLGLGLGGLGPMGGRLFL